MVEMEEEEVILFFFLTRTYGLFFILNFKNTSKPKMVEMEVNQEVQAQMEKMKS